MNKSAVFERPGWTAGRVEKFLVVEHVRSLHGFYGRYTEYEYSLPQILEAEKSPTWRKEAAKYLKVAIEDLDARITAVRAAGVIGPENRALQMDRLYLRMDTGQPPMENTTAADAA